ncbi:MAG: hypothetical protein ABIT16_01530 [Croceibacterium sp.]
MKCLVLSGAAALAFAAIGPAALAQDAPATCYLQVGKLMADPPEGVGEFGTALHQLEAVLRPQVDEIKQLRADLASVQQRQQAAMQSDESNANLVTLQDEAQRLTAELTAKQDQLKLDFTAQQTALVRPVQTRVSARAQTFATEHGCGEIKMARSADLAALQAGSARDVTGEFVTWYVADHS